MKKYLLLIATICLLGISAVTSATDFSTLLKSKNIDVNKIIEAPTISRERVVELINFIECHDCHRSPKDIVNSLTESRWNDFRKLPGKNFDDVSYDATVSSWNNYYCIAYVANKFYVNWFPRTGSPFCPWLFCAQVDITNADFLQAVFNVLTPIAYSQYALPRKEVSDRIANQPQPIRNVFTLADYKEIVDGLRDCPAWVCPLQKPEQLSVYTKYCRRNTKNCNMQNTLQSYSWLKEWFWPTSEVAILLEQWMFLPNELEKINIENYASGKLVFDVLSRLKMRMQCVDTDDQDGDGILDYEDNAYLTPNASQKDTDNDGIGDVIDDDLDNDTIKNPVGVVDDQGNIVYSSFKPWVVYDNCIFTHNRDQKDDQKDGIGNACEVDEEVWLRIFLKQLLDTRFAFFSEYSGKLTDFVRYFGDNETAFGDKTNHTYKEPWIYNVRLEAKTENGKTVVAYLTVNTANIIASASLIPNVLVQNVWEKVPYAIKFQNISVNEIDYVVLYRWDWRSRELRGEKITNFVDSYTEGWWYTIRWTVFTNDERQLSIWSYVTILWLNLCLPTQKKYRADHCDMDKDSIPDLCDDDIDGDGVKNPLWLIRYEDQTCTYSPENIIIPSPPTTGTIVPKFDVCVFERNPEQNECKLPDGDIDKDGIVDSKDACPTVPEDINGVNDSDGCPEGEIPKAPPENNSLKPGACNSCPCQYAKNDSAVLEWDIVKAVLYDFGSNKEVSTSNIYIVQ